MSFGFLSSVANLKLKSLGVKLGAGGAHTSRTMMLEEITHLLAAASPTASAEDYRRAAIQNNALGKSTETTREKTYRYLRELYGLSVGVPLFGIYRELMQFDSASAPLLSLLTAWARDPLLRATTTAVLSLSVGSEVKRENLQERITDDFPGHYSPLNTAKIARNAASSWTQSGHLAGRSRKVRCYVTPRPASMALALLLGYVSEFHGEQLFTSPWCRLLDLGSAQARLLAAQAHREELITMKAIGSVVEVGFPRFRRFLEGYL